ncbi:hypothetical protein [Rhizobium sp. BT-226]|uniref:hypothetical protein n=1 Tax=Rhizobium sp. BT-226 TaxID=2986922 RepID=UPI0021F7E890|nr:hypothetical protein [Rhizobium sp. BT-226]MCW0021366.1 hypothetical protein [Rhizobium sp. BT-226]
MARSRKRLSKNPNTAFGARAARRQQGLLDALAAAETGKAKEFQKKYGQRGKARGYAAEFADLAKLGPEANQGVIYQSWLRQKKLFVDPADPNTLVRQKRRLNGTTQKFERQLPLTQADKESGKKPRAMITRTVKTRGGKTIDSEYNEAGQLKRKLKLRSGGRFKEQWETDSTGKLIRTRFRTDRLRDGVFFSPVSERMSGLDQNGKRLLVQTKGRREKLFERDEKTGKLTLTGRKGWVSSEYRTLKADGSLAGNNRKWGKIWQKDVQYIGENSKRVTTRKILGGTSIRTVLLTAKELAEQKRRRDAAQKPDAQVTASVGGSFAPAAPAPDPYGSVAPAPIHRLGQRSPSPDISAPARVDSGVGLGTEKPFQRAGQDQERASNDEKTVAALFESIQMDGHTPPRSGGIAQTAPVSSVASLPQRSASTSGSRFAKPAAFSPAFPAPAAPIRQLGNSQEQLALAALRESTEMDNQKQGPAVQPASFPPPALSQPQSQPTGGSRFAKPAAFSPAFPAQSVPIRRLGNSQKAPEATDAGDKKVAPSHLDTPVPGRVAQPAASTSGSRFAKPAAFAPAFPTPAAVSTPSARTFDPRNDRDRGAAITV